MQDDLSTPASANRIGPGRLTLAITALVLAVSVAFFWSWWSHPHVLGQRTGMGFEAASKPLDQAVLHVGITLPEVRGEDRETITFKAATAHFAENSASATASFAVCVRGNRAELLGAMNSQPLSAFCDEVRPIVDGTRLLWADAEKAEQYIVMSIKPTTPGSARVDEVSYEYSRGWQHFLQRGEDRTRDVDVTVVATD